MAFDSTDHQADPVDIAVGARIRLLRKVRGLSQQALAEVCGITFQQIQKYERGANRVSASMITRIAKTLSVPVAEMFGETSTSSGAVDEVADLLAQPGALELLKAYSGLPRGVSRSALVEFVRSLPKQE
jgi:transcriptional regulator with XRE-family HTH domain